MKHRNKEKRISGNTENKNLLPGFQLKTIAQVPEPPMEPGHLKAGYERVGEALVLENYLCRRTKPVMDK